MRWAYYDTWFIAHTSCTTGRSVRRRLFVSLNEFALLSDYSRAYCQTMMSYVVAYRLVQYVL